MLNSEKQPPPAPTPSGGSGAHRAPHAQRYAMRFDDEVMCMEEADEGGYVSFDDYETLRQQYDVTAAALLAARRENETLRSLAAQSADVLDKFWPDTPVQSRRRYLAFDLVQKIRAAAATPEGP